MWQWVTPLCRGVGFLTLNDTDNVIRETLETALPLSLPALCVCVLLCTYVGKYACPCIYLESSGQCQIYFSITFHPIFWDRVTFWTWGWLFWLDQLANKLLGFTCLCLCRTGITDTHITPGFDIGAKVLGTHLQAYTAIKLHWITSQSLETAFLCSYIHLCL